MGLLIASMTVGEIVPDCRYNAGIVSWRILALRTQGPFTYGNFLDERRNTQKERCYDLTCFVLKLPAVIWLCATSDIRQQGWTSTVQQHIAKNYTEMNTSAVPG